MGIQRMMYEEKSRDRTSTTSSGEARGPSKEDTAPELSPVPEEPAVGQSPLIASPRSRHVSPPPAGKGWKASLINVAGNLVRDRVRVEVPVLCFVYAAPLAPNYDPNPKQNPALFMLHHLPPTMTPTLSTTLFWLCCITCPHL